MDSVMAVWKCTIIDFGRLNCCRKCILCCAFLVRELKFSSHLRSWVMMVPRELKGGRMGQVGLGSFCNPLPSPLSLWRVRVELDKLITGGAAVHVQGED